MKTFNSWQEGCTYVFSKIEAQEVKHISVDIFDTILLRTTSPEAVIMASSEYIAKLLNTDPLTARKARDLAWGHECLASTAMGNDPDARIKSLFLTWVRKLGATSLAEEVAEQVLKFELSAELSCLRPNPEMFALLTRANELGIPVTALSDMYLEPEHVELLLKYHGFGALIEKIIVSANIGLQKKTGRLFDRFIQNYSISGLIHIGDDYHADGIMPSSRNIHSVVVYDRDRMLSRQRNNTNTDNKALVCALSAIDTHAHSPKTIHRRVGLQRFGPMYTGFIHAVADRAKRDNVDSVWFLAREGWMLHELYEIIRETELIKLLPPSGYLYASRVATMRTQLQTFSEYEVSAVHSDTWSRTYKSTLSPLQLDDQTLQKLLATVGLNIHDNVTREQIEQLSNSKLFEEKVSEIGREERDGFAIYLKNTGFPMSGRVAIVDVGWGGQIQENLVKSLKLIGASTEIVGYYFGTDKRAENRRAQGYEIHSLIVDKVNNSGSGLGAFNFVQGIELATRAAHGTVKGYSKSGEPRLASHLDHGRITETQDDQAISQIQEGVLEFATQYAKVGRYIGVDVRDSIQLARDVTDILSFIPSKIEATAMTSMRNVANLGMDEKISLGDDVSIKRPRQLKKVLRSTLWQEGTCAIALPFLGPVLLLIYRSLKGGVAPKSNQVEVINHVLPPSKAISTTIIADSLGLSLTSKRTACSDYGEIAHTASYAPGILSCRDIASLFIIRVIHGAPIKEPLNQIVANLEALTNFHLNSPQFFHIRHQVRRIRNKVKRII